MQVGIWDTTTTTTQEAELADPCQAYNVLFPPPTPQQASGVLNIVERPWISRCFLDTGVSHLKQCSSQRKVAAALTLKKSVMSEVEWEELGPLALGSLPPPQRILRETRLLL